MERSKVQPQHGCQSVENSQRSLFSAVVDTATYSCAADDIQKMEVSEFLLNST